MNTSSTLTMEKTVYTRDQLQITPKPQVAVVGRSNVGKSSLINSLAGRKKLAKISSRPGKTRSINFYQVSPEDFYLVDLPGYGYAQCSKKEREKWARLIEAYLQDNTYLKGILVLLDSRLEPQQIDLELVTYLQSNFFELVPILTKADKCKMKQRSRIVKTWSSIVDFPRPPVLFSAKTGMNMGKIWDILRTLVQDA